MIPAAKNKIKSHMDQNCNEDVQFASYSITVEWRNGFTVRNSHFAQLAVYNNQNVTVIIVYVTLL